MDTRFSWVRTARPLVLLPALLAFGGCGPGLRAGGGSNPFASAPARATTVKVTVQNSDFRDATLYAQWQGAQRVRVGFIVGKTTETFTMEWHSPMVEFTADFVAGETLYLDSIEVTEEDHLDIVILNQGL